METAHFLIKTLPKLVVPAQRGGSKKLTGINGMTIYHLVLIVLVCFALYLAYKRWFARDDVAVVGNEDGNNMSGPHGESLLSLLRNNVHIGNENCPQRHDLRGTYIGKFISCYDGDTCDVVLLIPRDHGISDNDNKTIEHIKGMRLIRYRTRTMGYNAPEIRQPKDEDNRDEKKKLAVISRDILWNILSGGSGKQDHGNLVAVSCNGFDKYGRLLVQIWPLHYNEQTQTWYYDSSKESVNQYMLRLLGPEYAMDDKGRMVSAIKNLSKQGAV